MTTTTTRPGDGPPTESRQTSKGWFGQLLLRLHFYAGILVGPFIFVAAVSGALYALTPQVERAVYDHELRAPVTSTSLPLAEQVEIAEAHIGGGATLSAVRPAPEPGDTTRVMFAQEGLGESESRAVFVDPGTGEIRGDLTAYGTSGSLPLRTWVDQLHRSLNLGEPGRYYSELAASWLGVVALAGLALWVIRIRRSKTKKDFVRPSRKHTGYRRVFTWHTSIGIWVLLGALFLSATGITWSAFAGANVSNLRAALDWGTPSLSTGLAGAEGDHDEHAGHHDGHSATTGVVDASRIDDVLSVARTVNVNTGLVEIVPPSDAETAWVVQEIQRSFPTEVDGVAIDGATLEVVDRVDFAEFSLPAKLARWGIDIHMGTMFGLVNQLVMFVIAGGIAAMVVLGYILWWKRRPTRGGARFGSLPRRGALRRAPWWGIAAVLVGAVLVGLWLPFVGYTLAAFVVVDVIVGWWQRSRTRV